MWWHEKLTEKELAKVRECRFFSSICRDGLTQVDSSDHLYLIIDKLASLLNRTIRQENIWFWEQYMGGPFNE
jgi:hypothetical protein